MSLTKVTNSMIFNNAIAAIDYISPANKALVLNGTSTDDATEALQNAIDDASEFGNGVTTVYVDGLFNIGLIEPKSNVKIEGRGPIAKIVINNPTTGSDGSGVSGFFANQKTITNFHLSKLTIDGNRIANATNKFDAIVQFRDCTLSNFSAKKCVFLDPLEDFIRVVNENTNHPSKGIDVIECKFIGTKFNLNGINNYPGNALRTWNRFNPDSNYGVKTISEVKFINNYVEKCRTAADIKRGTQDFIVSGNHTFDLMDCDHSVDGSFNGILSNNLCSTSPGFNAISFAGGTNTNYIEIQGEQIVIANNVCEQNGVGKVNGILITDYGTPEESGLGHQSVRISVENNVVNNVNQVSLKFINAYNSKVNNNIAVDENAHSIAIDSGTGRNDEFGNPFVSKNVSIANNTCGSSIVIGGEKHSYSGNINLNGQDPFSFSSFTALNPVSDSANMFVLGGYSELNTNTDLNLSGSGQNNVVDFIHFEESLEASTAPYDTVNAITAVDTSTSALRELVYSRKLSAKINDKFFVKISLKQNSSSNGCCIIVQERDSSDAVTATEFYGLVSIPSDWSDYMCVHEVSNSTTAYINVKFAPAASFNFPTSTGNTDVAKFKIGRIPQGQNH